MKEQLRIKIIGVGGSGSVSVSNLYEMDGDNIRLYAIDSCINTYGRLQYIAGDFWVMGENWIQIGKELLGGLGAAACPKNAGLAAHENIDAIKKVLQDADIVILTAGLGGGIGSGVTPVVAELCKNNGIRTMGVFTVPFQLESVKRTMNATNSLREMVEHFDYISILKCDQLVDDIDGEMKAHKLEAWWKAWDIIDQERTSKIIRVLKEL